MAIEAREVYFISPVILKNCVASFCLLADAEDAVASMHGATLIETPLLRTCKHSVTW